LWHVDPLLGNDSETNNETKAVAMQQIINKQQLNYNEERCFMCGPCRDVISETGWVLQSVSQYMKGRLGGWFEMAASLGVEAMSRL
jgi:ferredoxin-like protein FixX